MKATTANILALLVLLALPPAGAALASPQAVVEQATSRVLTALQEERARFGEDPSYAQRLIDQAAAPYIDFRVVSRLALGKLWKRATPEQRRAFTREFRRLLMRVYSKALTEYALSEDNPANNAIAYLPTRLDAEDDRAKVRTKILRPNGPDVPVDYSLYRKNNAWKVYDVKVEGISLVSNYRVSFANEYRTGGMDGLIKRLVKRNQQPETTSKADVGSK